MTTERYDKFRAPGSMGWLTLALFADHERCPDPENAPFWLERNKTGDKRPVFREWFLHLEDMTGVKLAQKYLGNVEHWNKMYDASPWFKEAVDTWRLELAGTLNERAMSRIWEIMEEAGHATSLSAAKFLVERLNPQEGSPSKRGRPSKHEVSGELKRAVKRVEETDDDFARIKETLN